MDRLKGANYFTKLDVQWGYNNVRIKKGDKWKAAFKTKFGLYKPMVMFFGLCNSPATFQAMMDHLFQDLIARNKVIVYMDDILIFAKTKEELERITREVLKILQDNDLFLKPEKAEFCKTSIEYLGMIIEPGKISMDKKKLNSILEWPEPTTVKQTRSFLGLANFYWRFIRHFAKITRLLNDLLLKDKLFLWTPEAQEAFDELKQRFTQAPVLMLPDPNRPFQIESDASKAAYGAVLTQEDENGARHPCAFLSKSFTPPERNYEIYDHELLGII